LVKLDASLAGQPVDVEDVELFRPQDDDAVLAHGCQSAANGLAGEAKRVRDMRLHQGQCHVRRFAAWVQLVRPYQQLDQQVCHAFACRPSPDVRKMLKSTQFGAGEEFDEA
jgi:hypothetical protein